MKAKHIFKILVIQIVIIPVLFGCKKYGQFIDSRDGKTYQTIQIGKQTWMAENLNYDAGNGSWVYDNNSSNSETYGRYYNWETACDVCPDGWHLPSDAEWTTLTDYLGSKVAGGKMKVTGRRHWKSPNTGATNESGFSALPGGFRSSNGNCYEMGEAAYFWSSTELDSYFAYRWGFGYDFKGIHNISYYKDDGLSVRCVRD